MMVILQFLHGCIVERDHDADLTGEASVHLRARFCIQSSFPRPIKGRGLPTLPSKNAMPSHLSNSCNCK